MRYFIDNKHNLFFSTNKHLYFENIFNETDINTIQKEILNIYKKRKSSLKESEYELYRDLWRDSDLLLKKSKDIGKILLLLRREKLLRLAFDQVLHKDMPLPYLDETITLKTLSPIQGVIGGIFIFLSNTTPTPSTNFLFIKEDFEFTLKDLFENTSHLYLIAFSNLKAQYIFNENDLAAHKFKKLGYSYGDFLVDKYNPLII
jgi:hypothetical protein